MRIIAGKFRRRKLFTNPGLTTRPITDRVKESLLEQIQKRIQGKRVADIFAGTGTIGLEVLSRGAERVTFIEKDRKAIELLRANIELLECEDEVLVWPADVLRCSFIPKGTQAEEFTPWETVFFDPPYAMVPYIKAGSPLFNSMRRLARENVTTPDATLVFRVPRRADFEMPSEWEIDWSLTRSGMTIHICTKSETASEPETESENPS
ncbi:16S rRNA (guanine(966)-N(2))-methyltransferase RsmD [Thalassoglobus sp. JC818]|uniref:16S rRNA (guanine(966)-N(2))-methyltransferase RsmD n=1 Tax=Thalassoglobus sp. JC818 TaxID=3232136 RepID=UPI0034586537